MTSSWRRGYAAEYYVAQLLSQHGYTCERHPGSRGAADLDAYRGGVWLMVQVKSGKADRTIGTEKWNQLFSEAKASSAIPILANKDKHGKWQFWKLTAEKTGKGKQPMVKWDLK